ncbi:MAG: hypothetical protein M0D55_20650 [Elusimicrobiota bacterium]|nr:MAG: hypothetical protein M0D55_20650 [Elusimicrobiota bacterium]
MLVFAAALLLAAPAWCGVARSPAGIPGLPASSVGAAGPYISALPPYLSVANPADAVMLARVVNAAQASPTAVAVLAEAAKAAEQRGRPVVVEVVKMAESGTWNIDWGILSLRRKDLSRDPRANVATLIHELRHMLQAQADIPSDLLEAELDAYVVDFRVDRELGQKPTRPYDKRAAAAFKQGLEPFMEFLRKEYPEDAAMWRTRSLAYRFRLEKQLFQAEASRAALAAKRAERAATLERMTNLGHAPSELENFRQDALAPIDSKLQTADRLIAWARRDLAIFSSPARLASARRYARNAIRRARAFQKRYSPD